MTTTRAKVSARRQPPGFLGLCRRIALTWAQGHYAELQQLLVTAALPASLDPVRRLHLLTPSLLEDSSPATLRAGASCLDAAIANAPPEPNLFIMLLDSGATVHLALNERHRARACLDAAAREDPSRLEPVVRFWSEAGRAMYATAVGDREMKQRAEEAMLAARTPRGSETWCVARLTTLRSAIDHHDHVLAERMLQELSDQEASLRRRHVFGVHALAQLRLYGHARAGRLAEAFAIHQRLPEEPVDHNWNNTRTRTMLLIQLGRLSEANAVVARLERLAREGRIVARPGALRCLRAALALGRQDAAGAADLARQALREGPDALEERWIRRLLVGAELALGQPIAARVALGTAEPEFPEDAVLAMRLAVLERRPDDACARLRQVLERTDLVFLANELAMARELPAGRFAQLLACAAPGGIEVPASRAAPTATPPAGPAPVQLIGHAPQMVALRRTLRRYADLPVPLLLHGETGTGKEIAARLVHQQSRRRDQPFLAVDCGAIAEALVESELFGHVEGAFTGATRSHEGLLLAAGEGTILLDEVNSMGPRLQASLLRVLETGEVRAVGGTRSKPLAARLLFASNQDLASAVAAGRFRADLYYRLERLVVALPPLRDHPEDIPDLVDHIVRGVRGSRMTLSPPLQRRLQAHPWPGNVRELRNLVERMVLQAGEGEMLDEALLPERWGRPASVSSASPAMASSTPPRDRRQALRELFRTRRTLSRAEVVQLLGCAPNTATADLQHLVEEGTIRRVVTSGNLRTSYFESCG